MLSRVLQTCLLAPSEVAICLPAAGRARTDGWRLSVIDRPLFHYALSVYERRWSGSRHQPVDPLLTVHHPLIVFVRGRKCEQARYGSSIITDTNDRNNSVRLRAVNGQFMCQGMKLVRQSLLESHITWSLHLQMISKFRCFIVYLFIILFGEYFYFST
jgi:hypothetical protein